MYNVFDSLRVVIFEYIVELKSVLSFLLMIPKSLKNILGNSVVPGVVLRVALLLTIAASTLTSFAKDLNLKFNKVLSASV